MSHLFLAWIDIKKAWIWRFGNYIPPVSFKPKRKCLKKSTKNKEVLVFRRNVHWQKLAQKTNFLYAQPT